MDNKIYEISFVLSGKLIDAELADLIQKIKKDFEEEEAKIIKESTFDKINLAYPIKKETTAYFGYFWFELEPQKVADLRKKFAFENNILRYLIVTPPPKYQALQTSSHSSKKVYNENENRSQKYFESVEKENDLIANSLVREETADEMLEEKLEEIQKLA